MQLNKMDEKNNSAETKDNKGISNTTIAILIILALLISIIGTWAVLNSTSQGSLQEEQGGGNVGVVSLNIKPNPGLSSVDSGKIILEIKK